MERPTAPLEATRAVGRLEAGGPWIGFGYRAGACRLVVGTAEGVLDSPADPDLTLALAIAHFVGALEEAPPDLEATQSDLSALVSHLSRGEADPARQALLAEALDAIDDGLAGDAVAEKLAAARSSRTDAVDPVELLTVRAREMATGA
ncbi:MAG TPA: hypothetical protein VIN32_01585 [Candidatus Limnocylindria bacterium]|jgi:hypothetical protein